jgi:hypothetical protein
MRQTIEQADPDKPEIVVEVTRSELDGTIVIQIDTGGCPEDRDGPLCRIYLNDASLYENPPYGMLTPAALRMVFPIPVSSEHTPSEPATGETEHRP